MLSSKRCKKYRGVAFALLLSLLARRPAQGATAADALSGVAAATVLVSVEYGEGQYMELTSGSGMVVGPGVVVTNAHVVNEKVPTRIYVQNQFLPRTPATVHALRYDGNEYVNADVVRHITSTLIDRAGINNLNLSRRQSNFDIAILTFAPPPGMHPPILPFNLQAAPGESVVAAGYPDRGDGQLAAYAGTNVYAAQAAPAVSLSPGSVTRLINREPQILVHNARCTTGNSGGPLVNARGEVVGMQTWTSVPGNAGGYMSMAVGARDLTAFLQANGFQPLVAGYAGPRAERDGGFDARRQVVDFAEAGDADFQAVAGLLYFLGDCGFPRDDARAVYYLEQALRTAPGSPLAYLYKAGLAAVLILSPQFNHPEYAESLLRAANNSHVVDSHSKHPDLKLLAFESALNMQGRAGGIRYDPNRSLLLAEKAMEGGFALPYALMGYHYYFGDAATGRDHAKALRFAREAARNGIPEGISLLAHLYYDSEAVAATPDNARIARRLAEEAAYMGDPWALGLLANMFYDSADPAERAKARDMAMLALPFGNRLTIYCLGRIAWDDYLANPSALSLAARAWAYIEFAERQGVRPAVRAAGAPATSRDILARFSPREQERIVFEGRREQGILEGYAQ